jgi:hypothetical protein
MIFYISSHPICLFDSCGHLTVLVTLATPLTLTLLNEIKQLISDRLLYVASSFVMCIFKYKLAK